MKKSILLALILVFSTQLYSQNKIPKVKIWVWGVLQNDATENIVPTTQFQMRAARIILLGNFNSGIGYHIMADMYDQGNNRPTLMQAWFSYKINHYLQMRMGQFKYPFGTEAYGPLVKWKFVNPSFVTGKVVKSLGKEGSIFRDIGVQFSGMAKMNKDFTFVYKAMVMNGNGANTFENNDAKDFVGFVGLKLPYNIMISGSFFSGKSDTTENAFATTVQIDTKKYTAKVEYISATNSMLVGDDKTKAGFFAHVTYKITKNIEAGVRYDSFDPNTAVDDNSLNRTTIMAAYNFGGLNRIMLNYELRNKDVDKDNKWGNLLTVLFQAAL